MIKFLLIIISLSYVGFAWHLYANGPFRKHSPNRLCAEDVQVIVAYQTSPGHHSYRTVIRNTVGHAFVRGALPWRILFYMGYTEDRHTQNLLRKELLNNDLIVVPLQHHHRSAIPIFLETARWINSECGKNLRYLVHVSDTTFVDIAGLFEYLGNQNNADRYIHCRLVHLEPVERNPVARDAVPETVFRDSWFPTYCEAGLFVVGAQHLHRLVLAADAIPQYPLFPQYVTGHINVLLRLTHKDISNRTEWRTDGTPEDKRKLFAFSVPKHFQWRKLWLRSSVCFADTNLTTKLMHDILRKIEVKYSP